MSSALRRSVDHRGQYNTAIGGEIQCCYTHTEEAKHFEVAVVG